MELLVESIHEITKWFQRGFEGEGNCPPSTRQQKRVFEGAEPSR